MKYLREIINEETNLKMNKTRFLFNKYTYPINIVVFENKNTLAYFDPNFYQIGLNKKLIYESKTTVLKNILRHEFAHYITFLKYGSAVLPHGNEFISVCKDYNWQNEIISAREDIDHSNDGIVGEIETERIIGKVKKLLQLANSTNQHESQLATQKANQLMLRNQLALSEKVTDNFEIYFSKPLYYKKKNAKISSIYNIIKHFFVSPLLHYGSDGVYLEIAGSKSQVEIAEYVCDFLDKELDRLWKLNRLKNENLKGLAAKNAFFKGISLGYEDKAASIRSSISKEDERGLVKSEKSIQSMVKRFHRRMSSSSVSSQKTNNESFQLGKIAGKNLTINQSLKSGTQDKYYLEHK